MTIGFHYSCYSTRKCAVRVTEYVINTFHAKHNSIHTLNINAMKVTSRDPSRPISDSLEIDLFAFLLQWLSANGGL